MKAKQKHLSDVSKNQILVIGDLNVDNVVHDIDLGDSQSIISERRIGGSGLNSAIAFKNEKLDPIVFGAVGNDMNGKEITMYLSSKNISNKIRINENKATCLCNILYFNQGDEFRTIYYDIDNANEYDSKELAKVLEELNLGDDDYIFICLHILPQTSFDIERCKQFFKLLKTSKAKIIVDIVPHELFNNVSFDELKSILSFKVYAIIAEAKTLSGFLKMKWVSHQIPTDEDYLFFKEYFNSKYLICRYGIGNIEYQTTLYSDKNGNLTFLERDTKTGYLTVPEEEKRGFGDVLTAKTINKFKL